MSQQQQAVPALRFPEFNGEWQTEKIKDLSKEKLQNGVFNDPSKVGSGYRLINVKDMYSEGAINEKTLLKLELSEKEFLNNKVNNGDTFFTRSSLVKSGIAHSNVYLGNADDITFDGHLIRLRPDPDKVNPIFLNLLLKTHNVRKELVSYGKTATMTTIGQEDVSNCVVIYPFKPEQQKIAAFLGAVDEKIAQLQKKKNLLEDYKKGCMQKLFSQSLRFKDDNGNPFSDWEEKRLNQIATKAASVVTADSLEGQNGDYPVFGASGIAGYIDSYASKKKHIGIVKDGAGVGRVFLCPERSSVLGTLDSIIGQSENQTSFIYYWLSQLSFRPFITGSTIPHIYFRDYGKKRAKFPHPDEQKKIADFLSALDGKISLVTAELDKTKSFKKGLLQQMFV